MAFADKSINCVECGSAFTFTGGEQEFYSQKGYMNEPKRCISCRANRRAQRTGVEAREMHPAKCAKCNVETRVPFRPRGDRPVYCSSCFATVSAAAPSVNVVPAPAPVPGTTVS